MNNLRTQQTEARSSHLYLFVALFLALALKIGLVLAEVVPFNSDEAVVALMARHILEGERPIFFYGQAYMGSLDAWLVAVAFRLLGESVLAVRVVQIVLYLFFLVTLWAMLQRFFVDGRVANFAVILAAVPPVLMTTYTTASLGGYSEVLVLGNLVLWLGYEVIFGVQREKIWAWLLLGFVGGIGFWVLGLITVYLLAVVIVGLWKFSIKWLPYYFSGAIGFFIGSSLWWVYNFRHSWAAFETLFQSDFASVQIFQRIMRFGLLGLPALLGFRFPWTPNFAPWTVVFVILVFYQAVFVYLLKTAREGLQKIGNGAKLLGVFGLGFIGIFLISRFGIDVTGRYFLPLYVLVFSISAVFIAAVWDQSKSLGIILLILFVAINGVENVRAALLDDGITTQFGPSTRFDNSYDDALISFLLEHDEMRGYSNYWVSFRLAFLSQERMIFVPRLPYDISTYSYTDNRYPAYNQMVNESEKIAYITTKYPELIKHGRMFAGISI
ncbi:MAG: hypothetical protein B6I38_10645 [Anaerolineaceae bacterium 4572_5.1]|nr:MAG: hypothetical protein B6I38_10645 [Anaerolineaceae bacterium 4572_5.1]